MFKKFVALLIPLLLFGLPSEGGKSLVNVRKTISTPNLLKFQVKIEKLGYRVAKTKGGTFVEFTELPGVTNEIGKPLLPVVRKIIEVPLDATVETNLTIKEEESYTLPLKVKPVQEPIPKVRGAFERMTFRLDRETYETDRFYPDITIKTEELGQLRGHRLFLVEVYPVHYNPVRNEIRVIKLAEVTINFKGGNFSNTVQRIKETYSTPIELRARNFIFNYGIFEVPVPGEAPTGFLFIVPDEFLDEIEPFVEWKRNVGYDVIVAPTSITGSDTTSIRNYILDLYNDPNYNLTFVLLVGDVDRIQNWVDNSVTSSPATDLYYGTLEGDDYIPDVYVGRFSVADESELINVVDKVKGYEATTNWSTTDWLNKSFFLASADPWNHGIAEGTHLYCMAIVRSYGMIADSIFAYHDQVSPSIIAQHINAGYSQVTYSGHGSETGWADYNNLEFSVNDIYNLLSNGYMVPFVQTYACLSGKYTVPECFSEAWLRAPNKGGIASMASSVTSYWDEDDILQRRLYDEWFDSSYFWVMGLINEAKIELIHHYGNTSTVRRYFDMYNLMGDPSLDVYTNIAQQLTVSAPSALPLGPYTAQVTVMMDGQPVEGAYVAFTMDTILYGAAYTDESGNASVDLNIGQAGNVTLSVIAHNAYPYFDTIPAISEGPYVALVDYDIDDSGGNNNGQFNPGETINLSILAKNYGNEPASSVIGYLSSPDSLITILANTALYGTINPGDSVWSQTAYTIQAAQNIPDNYMAPFTIIFQDVNDSTWTSNFTIPIYAPYLHYLSHFVVDSLGNGNSVAEPGETVAVYINIENSGHMDLQNVGVKIEGPTTYLTFLVDSVFYGDIPAGSTAVNPEPFMIAVDTSTPVPYFPVFQLTISGAEGYTFVDSLRFFVGYTGLFCYVEGDTAGWTHGGTGDLWHVTDARYHSATHSFYDGLSGSYHNNMDSYLISPEFVLGPDAILSFWTWYEIESGFDYAIVEISTDSGATWQELAEYTGNNTNWTRINIDLSSFSAGTHAILRFRFTSDGSITYEGWYIDDIVVEPPAPPPFLTLASVEIIDSTGNNNGVLEPGETALMYLDIGNIGGQAVLNVTGLLLTTTAGITITDSISNYGTINPDDIVEGDGFTLTADSTIPLGSMASFELILSGTNYLDTVYFDISIGDITMLPTGPDAYGYYIYDSRDVSYTERPHFNWIEIDPNHGGQGTLINLGDDDTQTLTLPFSFKFYGQDYTQVSVCSNGFIVLGVSTAHEYINSPIPNPSEPNNIAAGLWDDLNPLASGSGKVYYYYDSNEGIFIIEYSGVYHFSSTDVENFEFILYDPSLYPTQTGDGEIVVQYKTAPSQDDYTVGIENFDGYIGLQYYYDGTLDEHASPITDSFAIKFTTDVPTLVEEGNLARLPSRFILYNAYPNPARGIANIRFAIPKRTDVRLDIYDITGRRVKSLLNGKLNPGYYTIVWNGRDMFGRKVASGIYFYRLKAGKFISSKKLVLLK